METHLGAADRQSGERLETFLSGMETSSGLAELEEKIAP